MNIIFKAITRWRAIHNRAAKVLAMNQRNLDYIYPNNQRKHFPLADNKVLTKEILSHADIPMPATYKVYSYFYELVNLRRDLSCLNDFIIKPARGRGGGGIIVITGRKDDTWLGVGSRVYSLQELQKHISDIIFGVYSFDLHDQAIIEERIIPHPQMGVLSPSGLADIRVILYQDKPALSMTRLPTLASDGKANLHQGAVGVGIDLNTGLTTHAILNRNAITHHPDTGVELLGQHIPYWNQVLDISMRVAGKVPLKYIGIDIVLTDTGPMLLEMNVRPGLEIQSANLKGLREVLTSRES